MFPKALTLLSVLALIVAVQAQGDVPQVISFGDDIAKAAEVIESAEAVMIDNPSLMKRGCVYDGCRCNVSRGGLACYGDNVYQCSPSGKCCNFGRRDSCRQCGRLTC
ncbi:hypothetical protein BGZ82_002447 [Podila clonocystis]|nr:hypothetical protein BGZ82_002447 [Podila clonocystis]